MKKTKIQDHRTAYFLKEGELCANPLLADGCIDRGTEFSIEPSPEHFREGHITALKKLGEGNEMLLGISTA